MSTIFPVFENTFKINTKGRTETEEDFKTVADLTTFSVSVDGKVQEFTPMDTHGWTRRLSTGKSVTISFKGKRSVGDPGNDYISSLVAKTGNDVNSILEWDLIDGAKFKIPGVINITAMGGESTDIDVLEFDFMSDGEPEYTPA